MLDYSVFQHESEFFVFVPSQTQRAVLLNHEFRDFAHRESLVQDNQADPGRTIPRVSGNSLITNLLIPI